MPIVFSISGQREFELKRYVDTFREVSQDDWPVKGPRSLLWMLRFCLAQTGGGPTSRVQQFMSLGKLQYSDGSIMEYGLIARVIEMAVLYDGISVGNIAAFELLARRFQLIEEKYKTRLPDLNKSGGLDVESDSSLFLGLGLASSYGRQAICVMPELSAYVGDELGKEAAISKGRLKAHETREQLKKLSKGGGKDAS